MGARVPCGKGVTVPNTIQKCRIILQYDCLYICMYVCRLVGTLGCGRKKADLIHITPCTSHITRPPLDA